MHFYATFLNLETHAVRLYRSIIIAQNIEISRHTFIMAKYFLPSKIKVNIGNEALMQIMQMLEAIS